jgi:hypothetical protein
LAIGNKLPFATAKGELLIKKFKEIVGSSIEKAG